MACTHCWDVLQDRGWAIHGPTLLDETQGALCVGRQCDGSDSGTIEFGIDNFEKLIEYPDISDVISTFELLLYSGYLLVIYD